MTTDTYSKSSGNAYSKRNLKRMELVYKDIDVKFAVNPSDYTQSMPNRATLTQTKGGAWIDAWGAGIIEFTIKGVTGVKGNGTSIDTGYQRWKDLEKLFDKLYATITDGEEVKDLIKFYNHTDNEFYYCYPTQSGIELYRSASKPHLYQYTINLWGIRKIGQPATSSGVIGNPNKSNDKGSTTKTTKNQTTTYSGSSSRTYRTADNLINTEVDTEVFTNTKTKTTSSIQRDCLEYLTNLEPLVGGRNGKISPITGFSCTQGITMQSSGTISNVDGFSGKDWTDTFNLLLYETQFVSKVSVETYEIYTKMKDYDPEVLSPEYCIVTGSTPRNRVIQAVGKSKDYDCTIYDYISIYQPKSFISKTEINHLKVILLESMLVYRELYEIYHQTDELSTSLTSVNMDRLIKNIRSMIMYFVFHNNKINEHAKQDISSELRKLEKVMTQIRTDIVDYL